MKKILSAVLALALLSVWNRASGQLVLQDFSSFTDGTTFGSPIDVGTGTWSQPLGTAGTGVVVQGGVLELTTSGVGARYRGYSNFWTAAKGEGVFTIDYLESGSVSITNFSLSTYGGAGFAIQLNGSNVNVSNGGTSVSSPTYNTYAATLSADTWYTINIDFTLSGTANTSTGTLTIFQKSNPSNILLTAAITAAGGTGALTGLNQVDVQTYGVSAGAIGEFDNIQLVPEPGLASLLMMGLAVLGVCGRRARVRN